MLDPWIPTRDFLEDTPPPPLDLPPRESSQGEDCLRRLALACQSLTRRQQKPLSFKEGLGSESETCHQAKHMEDLGNRFNFFCPRSQASPLFALVSFAPAAELSLYNMTHNVREVEGKPSNTFKAKMLCKTMVSLGLKEGYSI